MKKHLIWKAMAFMLFTATTACNNTNSSTEAGHSTAEHTEATSTATDSTATPAQQMAYVCPMECEGSPSMQPGKCPVCGMDLVKNPAYAAPADSTSQE